MGDSHTFRKQILCYLDETFTWILVVASRKKEGMSCLQGVRSYVSASSTLYRVGDAEMLASLPRYRVRYATVEEGMSGVSARPSLM